MKKQEQSLMAAGHKTEERPFAHAPGRGQHRDPSDHYYDEAGGD